MPRSRQQSKKKPAKDKKKKPQQQASESKSAFDSIQQSDLKFFSEGVYQADTMLKLQRTIGNQAVQRMIDDKQVAPKKESPKSKRNIARQQTAKPTIQRLNSDDTYYYNEMENVKEYKFLQAELEVIYEHEAWGKMLGQVRIYKQLTQNPFTHNSIGQMINFLNTIANHGATLRAPIAELRAKVESGNTVDIKGEYKTGKKKYRGRRSKDRISKDAWQEKWDNFLTKQLDRNMPTVHKLERLIGTLQDDVAQDLQAINFLSNDNSLLDNSMSWEQALFFARAGTSPNSSDILTEENLASSETGGDAGDPTSLEGGNISDVTALSYENNEGGRDRKVFKPNEGETKSADVKGIDFGNVQSAYRIMASSRIQDLIQEKMEEAGREFTTILGNVNFAVHDGQVGTSTDFASGQEGSKTKMSEENSNKVDSQTYINLDLTDVKLQRDLSNLQLYDIITGQGDRNLGNILIDQSGDESQVTGIDQDFAFTTETNIETVGLTIMPNFIDRYFADAIMAISEDEFRAALKGLNYDVIDAAVTRFRDVVALLQSMDDNQFYVAPGDIDYPDAPKWGDIDISDYRDTRSKSDYMGSLRGNIEEAYQALKSDLTLTPEQDEKGNWVIKYMHDDADQKKFIAARKPDGSDLWELVEQARQEVEEEQLAEVADAAEIFQGAHNRRRHR